MADDVPSACAFSAKVDFLIIADNNRRRSPKLRLDAILDLESSDNFENKFDAYFHIDKIIFAF